MPDARACFLERVVRRGTPTQPPAREPTPMRYRHIAAHTAFVAAFVAASAVLFVPAVKADDAPKDVKGLYLMSDYPAVTLRPGETSTVNLRLHNYDVAPARLALFDGGVLT